jgi:hypothetical protein
VKRISEVPKGLLQEFVFVYFVCKIGHPATRQDLVDLAQLITKKESLCICGNVVAEPQSVAMRKEAIKRGYEWLRTKKVDAFYVLADGWGFMEGAHALIQTTGVGRLVPNIVLMGYKKNWRVCPRGELKSYFDSIQYVRILCELRKNASFYVIFYTFYLSTVLDNGLGLAILRVQGLPKNIPGIAHSDSDASLGNAGYDNPTIEMGPMDDELFGPTGPLGVFNKKQGKGMIDVWWLYDDGGKT